MNFGFRISNCQLLSPGCLSRPHGAGENCQEFARLLEQQLPLLNIAEFGFVANLQPILTFRSFLLNDSNLVNEVISGFGPICFTIIRTNGCPSFYQLIADYIASFTNRQRCGESDDSQGKSLRSLFQLSFVHLTIRNPQFEFRNSYSFYTSSMRGHSLPTMVSPHERVNKVVHIGFI